MGLLDFSLVRNVAHQTSNCFHCHGTRNTGHMVKHEKHNHSSAHLSCPSDFFMKHPNEQTCSLGDKEISRYTFDALFVLAQVENISNVL